MKPAPSLALPALAVLILASAPAAALAQSGPPGAAPAGPPPTARSAAPVDLLGQWVSVVTEDWQWRMLTPPKGDYASLPLTAAGKKAADGWDLAADNAAGPAVQCRAYGAGAGLREPTRIRIGWADDNALKLETDAGRQVRTFRFVGPAPGAVLPALTAADPQPGPRSLQGDSKAQWFRQPQSRGLGFGGVGPLKGGALRVVTTNLTGGYLRKNGVPYSQDAVVTQQFNRHEGPQGDVWLTVTTIVYDPVNLTQPFITSTDFKKEAEPGKWDPRPCATAAPLDNPVTKPPAAF